MGVFEKILYDGISRGHVPAKTLSAREWYREAGRNFEAKIRKDQSRVDFRRNLDKKIMKDYKNREEEIVKPGQMYMYRYDPKYKDTLPYYDRFPLIFPFRVKSDRFWGINLHYLPLPLRAKLMDSLHDITNNNRYDDSTKLKISYQILNSSSKMRYFKPCVKQYLFTHTRSKFMYIRPEEWDISIFLPLENFAKKTKSQVWSITKESLGVSK